MRTNIFETRLQLTPAEYPWAQQAYETVSNNPWTHTEVAMTADLPMWENRLTETDRQAISAILRGFTVIEKVIGDHWANIANIFPKPEIAAMSRACSSQESVHAYAYDLLETSLGIMETNWELFLKDTNAINKLETYSSYLELDKYQTIEDINKLAIGIAVFGGCAEGVSLFSSFAVLLSYTKMGIFPGMNQILSWSVRDEDMHSVCAISLFKELIKQYPKARPTQKVLYEYFDATVEIEKLFLSQVFNLGSLSSGIVYQDALDFIYHRANLKLKQLGYTPKYKEGNNPFASWFYSLTSTVPLNDFFAQQHNGAAYAAKISQDFTNVTYNF